MVISGGIPRITAFDESEVVIRNPHKLVIELYRYCRYVYNKTPTTRDGVQRLPCSGVLFMPLLTRMEMQMREKEMLNVNP